MHAAGKIGPWREADEALSGQQGHINSSQYLEATLNAVIINDSYPLRELNCNGRFEHESPSKRKPARCFHALSKIK